MSKVHTTETLEAKDPDTPVRFEKIDAVLIVVVALIMFGGIGASFAFMKPDTSRTPAEVTRGR